MHLLVIISDKYFSLFFLQVHILKRARYFGSGLRFGCCYLSLYQQKRTKRVETIRGGLPPSKL